MSAFGQFYIVCLAFVVNMPRSRATSSSDLIVVDGEIGVMKKGGFFAHTNFVFEDTCVVTSPDGMRVPMNGHLYKIYTSEGSVRMVMRFEILFTFALRFCPILSNSQQSHILYFTGMLSFRRSVGFCSKVFVFSVGWQPDTGTVTWVLGPEVQNDAQGALIPPHQHQYFWYQDYSLRRAKLDPTVHILSIWKPGMIMPFH